MPPLEIRPAWRRDDAELERAATAFWTELGVPPRDATPRTREQELCCVIFDEGAVVAVSTAAIKLVPFVRARLAMIRIAVAPERADPELATTIRTASKDVLSQWSAQHPQEGLLGVGTVVEAQDAGPWTRRPKSPSTGLNLVGYTAAGEQLRVAWFDHARMD